MPLIGLSIKCLEDWKSYLKLAVPGFAMLFFEWSNFEIGIIGSGKKNENYFRVQVFVFLTFKKTTLKKKNPDEKNSNTLLHLD